MRKRERWDLSFVKLIQLNSPSKADDSHNAFLLYGHNVSFLINACQTKFWSAEIRDTHPTFFTSIVMYGWHILSYTMHNDHDRIVPRNLRMNAKKASVIVWFQFYCTNPFFIERQLILSPRRERKRKREAERERFLYIYKISNMSDTNRS